MGLWLGSIYTQVESELWSYMLSGLETSLAGGVSLARALSAKG